MGQRRRIEEVIPLATHHTRRPHRAARRGGVYVLVLVAAMIVTVIGLSAIAAERVASQATSVRLDIERARQIAFDGMQLAFAGATPSMAVRAAGAGSSAVFSIDGGTVVVTADDPEDGDLADWPLDPIAVRSEGYYGKARQVWSLQASVDTTGLDCTTAGIFAAGSVTVSDGLIFGDSPLVANGNITTSGNGVVYVSAYASGSASGPGFKSSAAGGQAKRTPPPSTVFDDYVALGTEIPFSSIPSKRIEKVLLSAKSNPYSGGLNTRGIYVVDCKGDDIEVRNCRILGTLVILNAGSGSKVTNQVTLEPYQSGFPSLLIQGSLDWQADGAEVSESSISVNFNPSGSPYLGATDSDKLDTYPCVVRGIMYVSGTLTVTNTLSVDGALFCAGNIVVSNSSSRLFVRSIRQSAWPPGFNTGRFVIDTSSWSRSID